MTRTLAEVDLPKGWPHFVKSALLHVVALAGLARSHVRGQHRAFEVERLQAELELLQQQLRLVSTRLSRMPPRQRPHHTPTERLELRASRGWNVDQTAEALVTTPETIATWVRRVDEEGAKAAARAVSNDVAGRQDRRNSSAKNRSTSTRA